MARTHSESMSQLQLLLLTSHPMVCVCATEHAPPAYFTFTVLGENIAYNQGYEDPGAFAVERWLASAEASRQHSVEGVSRDGDWDVCRR